MFPSGTSKGNPTKGDAESYAVKLERQNRRLWTERFILYGMLIGLTVAVYSAFPLKEMQPPHFIRYGDAADLVYTITPGKIPMSDAQAIAKTTLLAYVRKREKMDHVSYQEDDNWLRVHTDPSLWAHYIEQRAPSNPDNPRVKALRAEITRTIHTNAITPVNGARNTYNVHYTALDTRTGTGACVSKRDWIATLSYTNREMVVDSTEYQMNPTGITVVNWDIVPVRASGGNQC